MRSPEPDETPEISQTNCQDEFTPRVKSRTNSNAEKCTASWPREVKGLCTSTPAISGIFNPRAVVTCSSSPSQSLRLSSRYSMQYSKPLRIKGSRLNSGASRFGRAYDGDQSAGSSTRACASPVGPQLELLHHILKGDQVPDIKGHWVAEGICSGICIPHRGVVRQVVTSTQTVGFLCKCHNQAQQPVPQASLATMLSCHKETCRMQLAERQAAADGQHTEVDHVHCPANGLAMLPDVVAVGGLHLQHSVNR